MMAASRPAKLEAMRNKALALHQRGALVEALDLYATLLKAQPSNAHLFYLAGTANLQLGQLPLAAARLEQAVALDPKHVAAWNNLGNLSSEYGRLEEAVQRFEKAIALKPDHVDAHHNRGLVLKDMQRWQEALASFDQVSAIQPDFPFVDYHRATVLNALKRFDEALLCYDKVLALHPNLSQAHSDRGLLLQVLGRIEEALASYDRALAISPDLTYCHYNRGNALRELDRLDEALASYDKALALTPDLAEAYGNRALVLKQLNLLDEALASCNKAINLKPDYFEAYSNRGNIFQFLGRLQEALASYDAAIAIKPDHVSAHYNRGIVLMLIDVKRVDEVLACCNQVIALQPDHEKAYWNKSLLLLVKGDFEEGWPLYEWRFQTEEYLRVNRHFTQPRWRGTESLVGKTILLHAEQGLGDSIQFCRYAKLVSDLGAKVLLQVPEPLLGLFQSLPSEITSIAYGQPLPTFDYHCPLMSLPLAFKTDLSNIPSPKPYLSSQPAKVTAWRERLGVKTKPRVGLVWSGSTVHKNDHLRSLALAELVRVLPSEFDYVSLQKEVRDADKAQLQASRIAHFEDAIEDFTDTAALCALMDLVVSVDTSVAHLSAALGKPTWILLPYAPDWRWLLEREDSPWYPTVKLYRQGIDWRWEPLLARVAGDLRQWFAGV